MVVSTYGHDPLLNSPTRSMSFSGVTDNLATPPPPPPTSALRTASIYDKKTMRPNHSAVLASPHSKTTSNSSPTSILSRYPTTLSAPKQSRQPHSSNSAQSQRVGINNSNATSPVQQVSLHVTTTSLPLNRGNANVVAPATSTTSSLSPSSEPPILISANNTNPIVIRYKQPDPLAECDYDVNPTILYQAIEKKNWTLALQILEEDDNDDDNEKPMTTTTASTNFEKKKVSQAATWVIRKEKNNKLRWRLLPLHAAIIFQSPLILVETLLLAYPLGAQCKDDQGMLPIHLAFRNDAADEILDELLGAYPPCIHVKDRKGRVPLASAFGPATPSTTGKNTTPTTNKRASLIGTYSAIAVASERNHITSEANTLFEQRIQEMQTEHTHALRNIKLQYESQLLGRIEQTGRIEKELHSLSFKNEELERQMKEKVQNEAFLVEQIQALTTTVESESKSHEEEMDKQRLNLEPVLKESEALVERLGVTETSHNCVLKDLNEMINERDMWVSEKSALKNSMDAMTETHAEVSEQTDLMARHVEALTGMVERLLADQKIVREVLAKQEQDMQAAAMERERMLEAIVKQEADLFENVVKDRTEVKKLLSQSAFEVQKTLFNLMDGNAPDDSSSVCLSADRNKKDSKEVASRPRMDSLRMNSSRCLSPSNGINACSSPKVTFRTPRRGSLPNIIGTEVQSVATNVPSVVSTSTMPTINLPPQAEIEERTPFPVSLITISPSKEMTTLESLRSSSVFADLTAASVDIGSVEAAREVVVAITSTINV